MRKFSRANHLLSLALLLGLLAFCCQFAVAQVDDLTNGETDPIKLFEQGQDAHAKGDYKVAIQLYDAAIKLKPEFPEAEFQRAMALLSTNRSSAALDGFNRAVKLRPDWSMAYSKFGSQLESFARNETDRLAEPILRRAIELNDKDLLALSSLAVLRGRAGDRTESLKLIRIATSSKEATHETWRLRAYLERDAGDLKAAVATITRALELYPTMTTTDYYERAKFLLELNDLTAALVDLDAIKSTLNAQTPPQHIVNLAQLYARAGKPDESKGLLDALNEKDRRLPEVVALRAELADDSSASAEERAALEDLLKRDPQNASLLSRLGNAYRRVDAEKSQGYYYRALQIDPKNAKYATGYAAALVQRRQFKQAEDVLRQVISLDPDNYTAHANLALSLYEMKRYVEALPEYGWLARARPEVAATYFFIASAHDNLMEYPQALDAYQQFLARADPANNKLEIEKVNLRLPTLRAQIQRGQGAKRKQP